MRVRSEVETNLSWILLLTPDCSYCFLNSFHRAFSGASASEILINLLSNEFPTASTVHTSITMEIKTSLDVCDIAGNIMVVLVIQCITFGVSNILYTINID